MINWLTGWRGKLASIGAAILAIIAFGASKKAQGRKEERQNEREAEAATRERTKEKVDDATDRVNRYSDDDIKRVLRDTWSRH